MAACIVGWGHSRFGRFDSEDLESLIVGVSRQAMADAAIGAEEVDAIWLGNLNGGFVPDTFCSSLVLQADDGLRWKPATRAENACASGAAAYFSRHGDHAETLPRIAAKNHANGTSIPCTQIRKNLGFPFCNTISDKIPIIAAMHLCGEAGDMQIANANLAGVFNMGGPAVANYVSTLEAAQ